MREPIRNAFAQPRASSKLWRVVGLVLLCLVLPAIGAGQQSTGTDSFDRVRFLIGRWLGTSEGQPGKGTLRREYTLALNGRFIRVHNRSEDPVQEKNPKGEVHEEEKVPSASIGHARKRGAVPPTDSTAQLADDQCPFWPQQASRLTQSGGRIGHQAAHGHGDGDIKDAVVEWQPLNACLYESWRSDEGLEEFSSIRCIENLTHRELYLNALTLAAEAARERDAILFLVQASPHLRFGGSLLESSPRSHPQAEFCPRV